MTKYAFVLLLLLAGLLSGFSAISSKPDLNNVANSPLGGMGGRGGKSAEILAGQ